MQVNELEFQLNRLSDYFGVDLSAEETRTFARAWKHLPEACVNEAISRFFDSGSAEWKRLRRIPPVSEFSSYTAAIMERLSKEEEEQDPRSAKQWRFDVQRVKLVMGLLTETTIPYGKGGGG